MKEMEPAIAALLGAAVARQDAADEAGKIGWEATRKHYEYKYHYLYAVEFLQGYPVYTEQFVKAREEIGKSKS